MRNITLLCLIAFTASAFSESSNPRTFMFIGQPSSQAWQYMMENPSDRRQDVDTAFKALGGEVVSYYWGLGNGRNYITVTIPNDNELIQAIYMMRLPSGLLTSYEVIELMPSDQMSDALKRSKKLIDNDQTAQ